MISFKQYLNESNEFDIEKFKKDCDFVLNLLKPNHFLYRGSGQPMDDFDIITWRARLAPQQTPLVAHNIFNEYSEKRWGFPMRNWQFCTGDKEEADLYAKNGSQVLAIFPIGEFEWICNTDEKYKDLTVELNNKSWEILKKQKFSDAETQEKSFKEAAHLVTKDFDKCKWYVNENLNECINSYNEIMFKCDKYYAFNVYGKTFKLLKEHLW